MPLAIWTFERIRGSAFFSDPDRALQPLWERLDALGIPTGEDWVTRSSKATVREVIGLHAPEPDIDEYVDLEASLATPSLPPSLTMLAATSPERHSEPGRAGSVWAPPTLQRTTPHRSLMAGQSKTLAR